MDTHQGISGMQALFDLVLYGLSVYRDTQSANSLVTLYEAKIFSNWSEVELLRLHLFKDALRFSII